MVRNASAELSGIDIGGVVCLFARGRIIDNGGSEDDTLLRGTGLTGVDGSGVVSGFSPRTVKSARERGWRALYSSLCKSNARIRAL